MYQFDICNNFIELENFVTLNLSPFILIHPPTQDVVDNVPVVFSQNPQHHQLECLFDNSLYNFMVMLIVLIINYITR